MAEIVVTPEIRRAVARDDCKVNGHRFDAVLVIGSLAPGGLICSRCGGAWGIDANDREDEWGNHGA